MDKKQLFDLFEIEDLNQLPETVMTLIMGDISKRNEVYAKLLEINNFNVSFDWFQNIYEEELAQRKQNKQDFTPNSVSKLASLLTGNPKGWIHEPTAGNGSMIIADWWNRCSSMLPWEFFPSEHMVNCWELSNRAIPILLLNLSIRGIMGYVHHGDVLYQTIKMRYVLLNRKNNGFGFSEIIQDVDNKLTIIEKEK